VPSTLIGGNVMGPLLGRRVRPVCPTLRIDNVAAEAVEGSQRASQLPWLRSDKGRRAPRSDKPAAPVWCGRTRTFIAQLRLASHDRGRGGDRARG
jgi:hypothetical protein